MRLSDAIRLGALLEPQGFGEFYVFYDFAQHTCALGAAGDAIGTVFVDIEEVVHVWPWIARVRARCPDGRLCGGEADGCPVSEVIPHLNDDHRWTRERIADWVDTVDPSPVVVRADGEIADVVDARAPGADHPAGDDRAKDVVVV